MTITQFIEKAILGGWRDWATLNPGSYVITPLGIEWGGHTFSIYAILLDPEAWKAVGKVEGWLPKGYRRGSAITERDEWHARMRWMVDALAEGKSVEDFIATL